jgi:hypothetical protein
MLNGKINALSIFIWNSGIQKIEHTAYNSAALNTTLSR